MNSAFQKSVLIVCALLVQIAGYACGGVNQPVYAGKIEYQLDPSNPNRCTVTVTLDFDINEAVSNDSIWIYWGDYITANIHAVSITEDSVASAVMSPTRIYTHVYSGTHTYTGLPTEGYYLISFQNEYRINGLINIADGGGINVPFYLVARVTIDTGAIMQTGPLSFPPLTIGFTGLTAYKQNGLQQTEGGSDSISYSLAIPLETISNPVPQYDYPDEYCTTNGFGADTFSIDPATGNVLWTSPCTEGVYCYVTTLNQYKNGQLASSVMREQNIYVTGNNATGVKNIVANGNMFVFPNPVQNNVLTGTAIIDAVDGKGFLEIMAPDGRVLYRSIPVADGRFETDISNLASGIYFVHVQGASGGMVQKFIKP
jgi:hypothetical protein